MCIVLCESAIAGGISYAATAMLTTINPMVGLVSGATYSFVKNALAKNDDKKNILGRILGLFLSATAAKGYCVAMGLDLSLKTVAALCAFSIAASMLAWIVKLIAFACFSRVNFGKNCGIFVT